MGYEEHMKHAKRNIACAVITVSDTRTEDRDSSGKLIRKLLQEAGNAVAMYRVVHDDEHEIGAALQEALGAEGVEVVILNGGTGISPRDVTVDVVAPMLTKRLDGFGELFRLLSFQEIGAAAIMSRALAGVSSGHLIFCLPGSTSAVRLGMEKLILPQVGHMLYEVSR